MDVEEVLLINQVNLDLLEAEEQAIEIPRVRMVVRQDAFDMSDAQFVKNFRLTKQLTRVLIELVSPFMNPPARASALSVETKVLVALHFYGHGTYQEGVGKHVTAGISQASVSRSIKDVTTALTNNVIDQYIKFPRDIHELRELRNRFYRKYNFPGTIGCIDGTHIAIVRPNEEEHIYVNRKHYHSLNVQLICDENLRIMNVNARFPGSCHDAHIWRQSQISGIMENIYRNVNETFFLLGDSGYPLRPWLLTPLPEVLPNSAEERFNNRLKTTRSIIERCNGLLKNRFRCLLRHRTLHYQPVVAGNIVKACAILHNMCLDNNIEEPDEALDVDMGIYPDENINPREGINPDLQAGRRLRERIVQNHFMN